jgi:hypothetical protein
MIRLGLGLAVLLLTALPARAQSTLYVDAASGDDALPRAKNSAATPWRSIGRAAWGSTNRSSPQPAEAARAGDTVLIAAGTYDYSGTIKNRWGVVYNPVNEGTSASKTITFRATGPVVLNAAATASPVIGCFEKDYIVWQGPFSLNEASISIHPDTGTVVMAGGVTGCGVDGISVNGNGQPGYVDNHTGVRIEACTSCFVRNSTIANVRHPRSNRNGSGVMLYDADDTIVEHNRIADVDNGVFIKGVHGQTSQAGTIIRFNVLERCGFCITISFSEKARVYQNVARDGNVGIDLYAEGAGPFRHPVGDWVVNNTIENMSRACVYVAGAWHESVRVWNNVLVNCRSVVSIEGAFSKGGISWEHNLYDRFGAFARDGSGSYSFGQWKSTFAQDNATPQSVAADPRFAAAATADFRLCTGQGVPLRSCSASSPALKLGIDVLDLNGDGSTSDVIPAGAHVTNKESIGALPGRAP